MSELFAVNIGKKISENKMLEMGKELLEKERQHIFRYRYWQDQQRSMLAMRLIKHVLSKQINVDMKILHIERDSSGRPFVTNPKWKGDFNISHSGDWIILAVSEYGKIGVDIEGIKPIDFSIAKTFCSQREYAQLQKYDYEQKLTYFYSLWTLKESFVKLVGTGLYYPINLVEFNLSDIIKKHTILLMKNQEFSFYYDYHFKVYDLSNTYKIALCSSNYNKHPDQIHIVSRSLIVPENHSIDSHQKQNK